MSANFLNQLKGHILVLFDMDGVCAEFIYGQNVDISSRIENVYLNKRPIYSIINQAKKLSDEKNIEVGILSSCISSQQCDEKHNWLKKYMPFIEKRNIHILIWDNLLYNKEKKDYAKVELIQTIEGFDKIFLIEDKHSIIEATNSIITNCAHHLSEMLE